MSVASSPEFLALQAGLAEAQSHNRAGSTTPHVSVIVPSFSLSSTVLAHYAPLLAALEHRYLLPALMLRRITTCDYVLITSSHPGDEVLDYYARLADPDDPDDVRRRIHILLVPDHGPRGVADKLLDRPDLITELNELIGGRPGTLEPWNVGESEVRLALALGLPLNGTSPELWPLGFKSAGRRLFRDAGVPTPEGVEDVRDRDQIAGAIDAIRRARPRLQKVVVKQDNSVAGDGNFIVPTQRDGKPVPVDQLRESCLDGAPDWFADDLRGGGGVVEEMVIGSSVTSPSCQIDIAPDGVVTVLSTHEQELGGDNGQVYVGCSFPALPAYAGVLAEHALAVGDQLAAAGALGRAGIDFIAVNRRRAWRVCALEINLRRGGTTHPLAVLRHLVPGHYDAAAGVWRAESGGVRCYRSSDGLKHPSWTGMKPADAIAAVDAAGIGFDRTTGTGVVLHMLAGLMVDGRLGVTAVAEDPAEAQRLYDATAAALHAAAQVSSNA
jgi:hypothetical protein